MSHNDHKPYWIGARIDGNSTANKNESTLRYVDGTNVEDNQWNEWGKKSYQNDFTGTCIALNKNKHGSWTLEKRNCKDKLSFVCEYFIYEMTKDYI